jgi:hypothetical protein
MAIRKLAILLVTMMSLVLLLALVGCAGTTGDAATGATIQGTFYLNDQPNGYGITVLIAGPVNFSPITTPLSGKFSVPITVPGTYQVLAKKDGYMRSPSIDITVNQDKTYDIKDYIMPSENVLISLNLSTPYGL